MFWQSQWNLFEQNWYITLTMIFGSFIAGVSSEGGGAIAYPVLTLGFDITASAARNFSLAIQSVGMIAAALWIMANRVKIEFNYLKIAAIGGTPGIILGTYYLVPHIPDSYAKLVFVSFWLSFGIALFVINHIKKRLTVTELEVLPMIDIAVLLLVSFFGGVLTAIFGSGLDICTFAYITLRYNLSEKVATPTSVVLMASNALIGFLLHAFIITDIQPETFNYWLVSIPVVLVGAPLGAYTAAKIKREVLCTLLYLVIVAQFVAAMVIIPLSGVKVMVSAGTFLTGLFLFFIVSQGDRIFNRFFNPSANSDV